jgi:hypothetical protein
LAIVDANHTGIVRMVTYAIDGVKLAAFPGNAGIGNADSTDALVGVAGAFDPDASGSVAA